MREGRLTALCLATVLAGAPLAHAADASCSYPKLPYPAPVSSFMPYDVDYAKKKELEGKKQFADVQRLFDILSWQTFIALNWPVGPDGKPRASLSDKGPRLWEGWKESFEVFRDDGRRPAPWGAGGELKKLAAAREGERLLLMTRKAGHLGTVVDETLQAFSGPLIDQNGKWVRYEVLMNREEFDYIVDNTFYNLEGQFAVSQASKKVNFPAGDSASRQEKRGAMELKLSWKQLDPKKDIRDRFVRIMARIPLDPNNPNKGYETQEMGLVGMHIAIKTKSAPTWILGHLRARGQRGGEPAGPGEEQRGEAGVPQPAVQQPEPPGRAGERAAPRVEDGHGRLRQHVAAVGSGVQDARAGDAHHPHPRGQAGAQLRGAGAAGGHRAPVLRADRHPVAHGSERARREGRPGYGSGQRGAQGARQHHPRVPHQHHHGDVLPEGQPDRPASRRREAPRTTRWCSPRRAARAATTRRASSPTTPSTRSRGRSAPPSARRATRTSAGCSRRRPSGATPPPSRLAPPPAGTSSPDAKLRSPPSQLKRLLFTGESVRLRRRRPCSRSSPPAASPATVAMALTRFVSSGKSVSAVSSSLAETTPAARASAGSSDGGAGSTFWVSGLMRSCAPQGGCSAGTGTSSSPR